MLLTCDAGNDLTLGDSNLSCMGGVQFDGDGVQVFTNCLVDKFIS